MRVEILKKYDRKFEDVSKDLRLIEGRDEEDSAGKSV